MMMAWKYTIPAFVVPFMFVLSPEGVGLLLEGPWVSTVWTVVTALIGVIGIAGGASGWLLKQTALWERAALMAGGLLLVYSSTILDAVGTGLIALVAFRQRLEMKAAQRNAGP
jgi:TRAP-type uncharacterized transport system fused permease subunit